ncbi:fumarylacetoacetate hydrolase family protein [Jeotgalibacillus proteolyticus]|uniref:Fumarylacetoacetase n=1 Tax=Jeotgalibacillus proteolyticus TaxID=2082395 RepID=A0A2S5GH92_9BACL|nr:fumarylacetoacetate hydrolase family protein [Jeotgalibacillus proteolyticus]PPA72271.1 fumarylacetoacetase [Jeotgalibacillus proteolyticus]
MKFITFQLPTGEEKAGWLHQEKMAVDMHELSNGELPSTLLEFLQKHEFYTSVLNKWLDILTEEQKGVYRLQEVKLSAPVPRPVSIRDFYAFEQHVKSARIKRGLDIVPEWYNFPVFYFTNHLSVRGPDDVIAIPPNCSELDFELEIACVIGKQGRNIPAERAKDYIFGFCIMNDWSARNLQREEMKVGLGPAKGKDFATSLGPYLVTADEMEKYRKDMHYQLKMTAEINGRQVSEGNAGDLYFTFGQMIERASSGVTLYPGEVIGSGTVGSGCILELGTDVHPWLKQSDEVSLSIDGLGILVNRIEESG